MRRTLLLLLALLINLGLSAQDFEDVSVLSGIDHSFLANGTFGGGTSFVDFDGDGWDDITFSSHLGDSLYFFKNWGGSFARVHHTGIETTCQSKQVMWVDLDNDGDNDFFVACHPQANHLYENKGNMIFEEITVDAGLDTIGEYTFGTSFGDIDNDGDLDMVIFNRALVDNRNIILYENNGDLTFNDITLSAEVDSIPVGPFCGTFMDYNTDGYLDLYIAEDKYYGNVLFENDMDNTFTNASVATGLGHALDAMCVAPGDIDNDDDIDIFVTNTPLEGNHLFVNNGNGTYDELAPTAGVVVNGFDWGGNFFDVENDGDLDLYISGLYTIGETANSHLYINDGLGTFSLSSPIMPNDEYQSYSNAIGDFNNDGYPDIAVNNYDTTPSKLWKNLNGENKTGGNWIKLKLRGTQSNIDGYGTKLEVYAGGNKQLRYTYCGEGFIAQNATHEIFGLGTEAIIDSIVVTWLSGIVDVFYNQAINQDLLIIEGGIATGIANETPLISQFHAGISGQLIFGLATKDISNIQVKILMIDGKELISKQYANAMPGQLLELNMKDYPSGVYVFSLSANGKVWSQTFVLH